MGLRLEQGMQSVYLPPRAHTEAPRMRSRDRRPHCARCSGYCRARCSQPPAKRVRL